VVPLRRCGEGKEFSCYTVHEHLNALRLWWHIDPRDPPAPQSLPRNHDLHVGHPRRISPAPSLSLPRSVRGVTRVVPAPKSNKTKNKVRIAAYPRERGDQVGRNARPFSEHIALPRQLPYVARLNSQANGRGSTGQRKKERNGKMSSAGFLVVINS
jgi:hypothetical protein